MKMFYRKNVEFPEINVNFQLKNVELIAEEIIFNPPEAITIGENDDQGAFVEAIKTVKGEPELNFIRLAGSAEFRLHYFENELTVRFAELKSGYHFAMTADGQITGEEIDLAEKILVALPNGQKILVDQISFKDYQITSVRVAEDVYETPKKNLFGKKEKPRVQIQAGANLPLEQFGNLALLLN